MRIFRGLMLALVVSACSGGGGLMDGIMGSWKGASIDQVITQWGYPDAEKNVAGRKLYVWSRDAQLIMPTTVNTTGYATNIGNQTYYNGISNISGGGVSNWNCTRILEVDASEVVVGGQWSGNNCPFMEAGPYANWRKK